MLSLTGDFIKILVGPEPPLSLRVHKDLICNSSVFFKSALSHDWKESQEQTVRLVEEDPEIVKLYIHWLYPGRIFEFSEKSKDNGNKQYLKCAKAYVLGDRLQDGGFCDAAVDVFMDGCQQAVWDVADTGFCSERVIIYIYENTTESSKLRELLVDVFAIHGDPYWIPKSGAPEFAHSIASKLLYVTQDIDERKEPTRTYNNCKYHNHGTDRTLCYSQWSKKRSWYEAMMREPSDSERDTKMRDATDSEEDSEEDSED